MEPSLTGRSLREDLADAISYTCLCENFCGRLVFCLKILLAAQEAASFYDDLVSLV